MANLLDLSLRNKLLNFKPGRSVTLEAPDPQALAQRLGSGNKVTLVSRQNTDIEEALETSSLALSDEDQKEPPPSDLQRGKVFVHEPEAEMEKRLITLFRDARTALEEGGANILYLAFGFLQWNPSQQRGAPCCAPLFLLPVSLQRNNVRAKFFVQAYPDETRFNPVLVEMLRQDFKLDLKSDDLSGENNVPDLPRSWAHVRNSITSFTDWKVTEEVILSTFSFSKYLMWRDLKRLRKCVDKLVRNRVVRLLINPAESSHQSDKPPPSDVFYAGEFDRQLDPSKLFCPLPADSSQLAAIVAARQGKDFVLEGPPGTGKSQTIANLIAQFLSEQKTVLFVSEKIAALEVVYRRLREVGLGDFCLELHSNKASKASVLAQLNAAWNTRGASSKEWAAKAEELKILRDALNNYVQRLHHKHTNGLSIFAAIGTISKNSELPKVELGWESIETHDTEYLGKLREAVKALSVQAHAVSARATHPLFLIGQTQWSPRWQRQLVAAAEQLLSITQELKQAASLLTQTIGLKQLALTVSAQEGLRLLATILPNALGHNWSFAAQADASALAVQLLKGAALLRQLRSLDLSLTVPWPDSFTAACEKEHAGLLAHVALYGDQESDSFSKTLFDKTLAAIENYREQLTQIAQHRNSLSAPYTEVIDTLDIEKLHSEWEQAEKNTWPKSWLRKRHIRKQLRTAIRGQGAFDVREDLRHWKALRELRQVLEAQRQEVEKQLHTLVHLGEVTNALWQGNRSEVAELEYAFQFQRQLAKAITLITSTHPEQLTAVNKALELCLKEGYTSAPEREIAHFLDAVSKFDTARRDFVTLGQFKNEAKWIWNSTSLDTLADLCQCIVQAAPQLSQWCVWQDAREHAINLGLASLVHALEQGLIKPDQVLAAFETSYASYWLDTIAEDKKVAHLFDSPAHEQQIRDFRQIDDTLTTLSRNRLRTQLWKALPDPDMLTATHTEWRLLLREIQKKKGHLPLRKLFTGIPNALTKLTPCLLMSPMSISQYLSIEARPFDLVIFDEASQIPTWEAIGAIARGTQVVMVGDPKQLPPSSFFDRAQVSIDDDSQAIPDMDSILDECIASGLHRYRLRWHYRSHHESLITFSNRHYYDSNLITFPSPETKDRAVSVQFVNGTHNRGKGGDKANPIEAQALVDEVVTRLLSDEFRLSRKTLGVVTFNRAQQQLVEDLFDASRRKHPQIEPYFSGDTREPIFIKSLEEVQGDERDIIYFSLTYGPGDDGRLSLTSLSQLTRQGGERRLNVAITRARCQMRLFSSFRPDQINLSPQSAQGVSHLKLFLEFAERGVQALLETHQGSVGAYESPFEEAVAAKLMAKGWRTAPQIGVSSFRIDIGVVDPDDPSRYLAGVECDGATYHSSATARDRDKLRQLVLEGLGWVILRVWSTNWWLNEHDTLEQLDRQLRTLLQARRSKRALSETVLPNHALPD
ncbi:hypothetical protein AXK11_03785 [Cephaloticoccus primus]|uniref:DNA helicase n=1 Tax=Cephaloticoccus primus TaxID=1548207 RepID=A0A139SQB8_9BACT|nr:DUF4011 domain-containing protein [Cephaloticoccus primus]KXU36661.1 hypothetical protein AXK11_03785 [Cephaloticoccus primus]